MLYFSFHHFHNVLLRSYCQYFFAMILMYNVQFIIFKLNVEYEQKKRYLRELEGQFVKQNNEKLYCYPKS